ncbi:hypothetical protein [Candidatus Amarolinea aalborgensis]|jgi:hypothetical protein|uniref:hypothetical protein n=1 Tax=Candidatus Amarolinea aalborgensis TaxID=2249329 RepID=UPI003BF9543C
MALVGTQPNLFDLQDRKNSISYTPAGIGGVPRLTFESGGASRVFTDASITVTETPAGALVSVLVEVFPDVRTKTLNLFVPIVNLPEDATEFPVETVAVLATKRTPLGGTRLYRGQAQTYETLKLKGTARLVDF